MNQYKGVHCIYDFVNICCDDLLLYQHQINAILDKVIADSNLNQIDQSSQLFNGQNTPPGFANVRVLDESHLSVHSYSEQGILAADLFTCGSTERGREAGALFKQLVLAQFPSALLKHEYILNRFPTHGQTISCNNQTLSQEMKYDT